MSATAAAPFIEAADAGAQSLSQSGTVSFGDIDANDVVDIGSPVTATDSASATAADTVTITITGANDTPTVSATAAAPFIEAADAGAQSLSQSGTVSFGDIDANDVVDIGSPVTATDSASATAAAPFIEAADAGAQSLSQSGTVSFGDIDANDVVDIGSPVTATDSASATAAAPFIEAADAGAQSLSQSGTVSFGDIDANDVVDIGSPVTATDSASATAADTVTITITGANDTPTVSATAAAPFIEAADAGAQSLSQSGTVSFGDIDANDVVDIGSPVTATDSASATAAAPFIEAADAGAQSLSQSGTVSFGDIDANDVVDIGSPVTATDLGPCEHWRLPLRKWLYASDHHSDVNDTTDDIYIDRSPLVAQQASQPGPDSHSVIGGDERGAGAGGGTQAAGDAPAAPTVFASIPTLSDYLVNGYWGGTGHHWTDNSVSVNITDLTAAEQTIAQTVLNLWHEVCNVDFTFTTGSADIIYNNDGSGTAATTSNWSGTTMTGATVDISSNWAGGAASWQLQLFLPDLRARDRSCSRPRPPGSVRLQRDLWRRQHLYE